MDRKSVKIAAFVFALPGVFLLYETGDHGAEMVFGYGAGTGQLLQQQETESTSKDSLQVEEFLFAVSDNGNWTWEIGPNGVSTLLKRFQWLEGTVQDIQPTILNNKANHLLQLTSDSNPNFFVGKEEYQNVQVDYYFDISDFEGEISLVNHVQDPQNYDFVTLSSEGTISQGRVSNGKREVFGEEEYSASGMLFVRTVVNDTHFRAYINKEMAVHGHGDAPEAGSVGLRLNGSGTIIIDSISLAQLN
jgi:hypothetical protein